MEKDYNNKLPFTGWHRLRYAITREYLNPIHWWWYLTNSYQRQQNGICEYDTFGFDNFLDRMLIQVLPTFKNSAEGCYGMKVLCRREDNCGCYDDPFNTNCSGDEECEKEKDERCKAALAEWDEYIDQLVTDLKYIVDDDDSDRPMGVKDWKKYYNDRSDLHEDIYLRLGKIIEQLWT